MGTGKYDRTKQQQAIMAEQGRLAGQRFHATKQRYGLAEQAVRQMDASTNQRDYVAARGAALSAGWRPERPDGVYGQGWKSAPQANTGLFSAATAPVSGFDQASKPEPAAPAVVKPETQAVATAPEPAPKPAAAPTAPVSSTPTMSTQQMATTFFNRDMPDLARLSMIGSGRMSQEQILQRMDDYEAEKAMQQRNKMNEEIEEANRRFRESKMAAAPAYVAPSVSDSNPSSGNPDTAAQSALPALPGTRPDYTRGRRRRKGLGSLRAL